MRFKYGNQEEPPLGEKEKLIEFMAMGLAVLLLLACALKVLFF